MRNLREFRAGKPAFYPDQAVYAAYSSAELGLNFEDIDGGTGLVFRVASKARTVYFGAGRCSWYPQNNATAATLASDKYFANRILQEAGIATLSGDYFFLKPRLRAHRPPGHERDDAFGYFGKLNGRAFVKPLTGSRGDFAQTIHGEAELDLYLHEVSQYYDAVLMQPVASGLEYRIFLLDEEIVYSARKFPPALAGDGVHSVRDVLVAHNAALTGRGLSAIDPAAMPQASLDVVLPKGEHWEIPGRMNLSVGGSMAFESPRFAAALTLARKAAKTLRLRAAAVDLFADIGGDPDAIAIIEVNSNPSIRLLEELERADLILKIWRHTFSAVGLIDV
jgi:glutathione synthase/RimK-type ligase-like ATP-grasp enzyme